MLANLPLSQLTPLLLKGYEQADQSLKLTISTPNFLHPLGPESGVLSSTAVVKNRVKLSYSLLMSDSE
jgi:hypothetical protein